MSVVGEAVIKLVFDAKSGEASIKSSTRDIQNQLTDAQKSLIKTGSKLVSGVFIAGMTSIAGLAADAVKKYAEFEQISGGIQKIFDEMDYKQIEKDAKRAYKTMNISAAEYMEQISGIGATFAQTMGDEKGYNTAKQGMQALADYASGTGKSVDTLMEKYQMISRSTSSYLSIADQFAGILPQTTKGFLEQAQASGYLSKEYKKLSEVPVAEYQQAISQMLEDGVKDMGLLGNTTKETEGTISGSLAATKASWDNVVTSFVTGGDDLDENIGDLADNIGNLADNVLPKFFSAFGEIFKKIFEKAPVVTTFAVALGGVATAVWAINTAKAAWTATTAALSTVMGIFNVVMQASPIFLIVGVIAAIIGAIVLLVTHIQQVKQWFENLGKVIESLLSGLGDFADAAVTAFTDFANNAGKFAQDAWNGIKQVFSKVGEFFGSVFSKAWERVKAVFSTGGKIFDGIKDGIVNAFKTIVNAIIRGINKVVAIPFNAINGVLNGIRSIDIFGAKPFEWIGTINVPQIPQLARGGITTGSTLANIGEAGQEAVIPLERNTDAWARPLASALAEQFRDGNFGEDREINVYMTNNINNNLDADEIGQRLMTSIRRAA